MVISYPLTKVKGYFYLTIFVRNGKYHSYKKTSRKIPEVFLEVMQAQVYYTLINP